MSKKIKRLEKELHEAYKELTDLKKTVESQRVVIQQFRDKYQPSKHPDEIPNIIIHCGDCGVQARRSKSEDLKSICDKGCPNCNGNNIVDGPSF